MDVADEKLKRLRHAIQGQWPRVHDVFTSWDENGDGQLSRGEWCKVITSLCNMGKEDASIIFDSLDADGNGNLDFREVNHALRAGAEVELDAALQDGAVEIQTGKSNKHAIRTDIQKTHSRVLTLQMGPGESIIEQIRNALAANFTRVRELWLEWDEDGSGTIDEKELFHALTLLGLNISRGDAKELFIALDTDGSGTVEFEELKRALHDGASVELDSALRAGAVSFSTDSKNKVGLRKNGPGKTGSNVVNGLLLQDGNVDSVFEQLRTALIANLSRSIDLFREMDVDQSGTIDQAEFHKFLGLLGLHASKSESSKLFGSLDVDGSGTIEFSELHARLRQGGATSTSGGAAAVPRYYRGPVTARDSLVQMLPKLGARLLYALGRLHVDKEDRKRNVAFNSKEFVQAIDTLTPLTTTGREDGQRLTVTGKRLHEELHNIFSELVARLPADERDGENSEPRLAVKTIMRQLRDLAKEGEAPTLSVAARGAAAMSSATGPIISPMAPQNARAIFIAAVRSGLTAQLFESWDTESSGFVNKETFRRGLAALHISVFPKEANYIFDTLDSATTGMLAYAELDAAIHRLAPSRTARPSGKKCKRSPRFKPKGPSSKSQYVTEMIETLGEAYFLPAVADATHVSSNKTLVKVSPRVHDRIRPTVKEPFLPDLPTPRKSPRKLTRETVLPRDPVTGGACKPSPRSPTTSRKVAKSHKASTNKSNEAERPGGGEDGEHDDRAESLPAFSPRHAKLLNKAAGGDGSDTPKPPEQAIPWCPAGRRKVVPQYEPQPGGQARGRRAVPDPGQAEEGLSDDARVLMKEKERRERMARNQANERIRLAKANERIKELEKRLQLLEPGETLPPPPMVRDEFAGRGRGVNIS